MRKIQLRKVKSRGGVKENRKEAKHREKYDGLVWGLRFRQNDILFFFAAVSSTLTGHCLSTSKREPQIQSLLRGPICLIEAVMWTYFVSSEYCYASQFFSIT